MPSTSIATLTVRQPAHLIRSLRFMYSGGIAAASTVPHSTHT